MAKMEIDLKFKNLAIFLILSLCAGKIAKKITDQGLFSLLRKLLDILLLFSGNICVLRLNFSTVVTQNKNSHDKAPSTIELKSFLCYAEAAANCILFQTTRTQQPYPCRVGGGAHIHVEYKLDDTAVFIKTRN